MLSLRLALLLFPVSPIAALTALAAALLTALLVTLRHWLRYALPPFVPMSLRGMRRAYRIG